MLEHVDPAVVGFSEERLQRVTDWLQAQVSGDKLAGASVLVARHGKVAYQQCAGMADKETGKPFAADFEFSLPW